MMNGKVTSRPKAREGERAALQLPLGRPTIQ